MDASLFNGFLKVKTEVVGIYARTLQSDGQLDSAPFRINTSTSGDQNVHGEGSVIALPDGEVCLFLGDERLCLSSAL